MEYCANPFSDSESSDEDQSSDQDHTNSEDSDDDILLTSTSLNSRQIYHIDTADIYRSNDNADNNDGKKTEIKIASNPRKNLSERIKRFFSKRKKAKNRKPFRKRFILRGRKKAERQPYSIRDNSPDGARISNAFMQSESFDEAPARRNKPQNKRSARCAIM